MFARVERALSVKLSHAWDRGVAVFDDANLVSCAGLVPVMELAEQTGLSKLLDEHVRFTSEVVKSGAANPTPKLTSIIAGLTAGADSIDDLDVIRAGGTKRLFCSVYAPTTLGTLLREFTGGHVRQLQAVQRRHLLALVDRAGVLAGIDQRAFVDIDSLLRPVYGHAKQGASFGHTKIAGKQVLRKGLSPLVTAISTPAAAPVIAGIRLRAGRAGSGRGAGSMVTEAINTAKAAGATNILVRGDAAYGTTAVIAAARRARVGFSVVLTRTPPVNRAIDSIPDQAWVPVRYPGAVKDPDTGEWISDAEVAEVAYTAFAGTPQAVTARLIVRRVRDRNFGPEDEMFPVWRYHPFFTNSGESAPEADITHRRHAVIETVFADLIDGPLAHMPCLILSRAAAWSSELGRCVVDGSLKQQPVGCSARPEISVGRFCRRVAVGSSSAGDGGLPVLAERLSECVPQFTVLLFEVADAVGGRFEPAQQRGLGGSLPSRLRGDVGLAVRGAELLDLGAQVRLGVKPGARNAGLSGDDLEADRPGVVGQAPDGGDSPAAGPFGAFAGGVDQMPRVISSHRPDRRDPLFRRPVRGHRGCGRGWSGPAGSSARRGSVRQSERSGSASGCGRDVRGVRA